MDFGEKLRLIRKARGITQEELAEQLQVSRQAISKWEAGAGYPETEKLMMLSGKLGVSLDYLMDNDHVSKTDTMMSEGEKLSLDHKNGLLSVQIQKKLYIIDVNKRKLTAFDEFAIEMLANTGNADLISGITKSAEKVKVPVCVLYGVTKGVFGMNQRKTLGFYSSVEDAKKELNNIANVKITETVYELKYAARMQGVRIAENADQI